jgi:hypothetical protein
VKCDGLAWCVRKYFTFVCACRGVPKDLAIPKVVCLCSQVYNFLVSDITKLGLSVCYTSSMTMWWRIGWVDFVKIEFHLNKIIEWWGHAIWIRFIKFNEIQIQLDSIDKKRGDANLWTVYLKSMLITFIINDYGVGKSKTTSKKCLSIPFRFQTEIYFSIMKQLKLVYLISPPMWTLNFCTLYQLRCYDPHWNY